MCVNSELQRRHAKCGKIFQRFFIRGFWFLIKTKNRIALHFTCNTHAHSNTHTTYASVMQIWQLFSREKYIDSCHNNAARRKMPNGLWLWAKITLITTLTTRVTTTLTTTIESLCIRLVMAALYLAADLASNSNICSNLWHELLNICSPPPLLLPSPTHSALLTLFGNFCGLQTANGKYSRRWPRATTKDLGHKLGQENCCTEINQIFAIYFMFFSLPLSN